MAKLEPGRYRATILYHTMTENSAKHAELRLTVLPTADAGLPLPPKYKPTPIVIFLTLTDGTIGTAEKPGWVLETLKHLGFEHTDLTTLDPTSDIPHSFTGRVVTILGSNDTYKGKERTRWNILRHENESKPVASNVLLELSKRHEKALSILKPPTSLFGNGPPDKPPF